MVFCNLLREQVFFRSYHQRPEMVFRPGLGLGHLEKSRARAGNRKTKFPSARRPRMTKKGTTLSGMVVRNFFTFHVLPDRIPTGGILQNTGIFGHFGPGQPLALREIPGLGRKWKKQFPGARGTFFGGKSGRPKIFSPKVRNFFQILRFGQRAPHGREIAKYGGFRLCGLGRPLALGT